MVEKNSLKLFYQERVLNHLEIIEMGEHCRVLIHLYNSKLCQFGGAGQ